MKAIKIHPERLELSNEAFLTYKMNLVQFINTRYILLYLKSAEETRVPDKRW